MVSRSTDSGVTSERVVRHCSPDHTNLRETLDHSREHDGRYNPRGEFGAVYVACDEATMLAELDRRAARAGLTRADLLPRVILTLELRLQKLLDLTDESIRAEWGVDLTALTREDDYTICHEIARAARRGGYEAIRFPGALGGANYAVFLDRLQPGSSLIIKHERMLEA